MVVRQLAAILALPCTVAIAIPLWIARRNHTIFRLPGDTASIALSLCGVGLFEEPMLVARFGEPYARYRRAVRRFAPRLRAWNPEATSEAPPPESRRRIL